MLYTIDEIAQILGLNPRTIRRYIEKGQLRGERIGGSWRISEQAFKEMFDAPDVKESITKGFKERSEDMLALYLQGTHRLQKDSVVMTVFVFDPQKEPWVLAQSAEWMAELNRLGQNAHFDFTIVGNEQGHYRFTLIAGFTVTQAMMAELERLSKTE